MTLQSWYFPICSGLLSIALFYPAAPVFAKLAILPFQQTGSCPIRQCISMIERSVAFPNVISLLATQGKLMSDKKFLTAEEVSERYRGSVSVGTLRNWRAIKFGPTFVKIGKAVLYPANELDAWDQKNTVTCRTSNGLDMDRSGGT
jgi:hypothetical protein